MVECDIFATELIAEKQGRFPGCAALGRGSEMLPRRTWRVARRSASVTISVIGSSGDFRKAEREIERLGFIPDGMNQHAADADRL
jgi:hypothetical protein